ncbi:MAG: hypothetical protein CM1200mP20_03500 [Pseudomonadota bacterium]|nr:MAG: hypothetical protein CM1200mP20_03500 [Pseudomonadota bacterium]
MILLDLPHSRDYFQQLFQHLGNSPRIDQRTASSNWFAARLPVVTDTAYSIFSRPRN